MSATATGWVMYGSPETRFSTLVALGAEVVGLAHALDLRRGQMTLSLSKSWLIPVARLPAGKNPSMEDA